jgi:uncharacterized membrane protein
MRGHDLRSPSAQGELQPAGHTEAPADPSPARVEAFSDGVFAFGVTLLILGIRIPHPTDFDASAGLLTMLGQQWRSYLVYALSFLFVGNNWINHRTMFSKFARTDHALVWLNLVYLMVAGAFIPLPTAVLGEWLGSPRNEVVAAVFYGATATFGALLFNVLWWYGAYAARLTSPEMSERERHAHTMAWAPAPFVVAACTAVAFVNPSLAVAGYLAIVGIYLLPTPALMALLKRRFSQRSGHRG